MTEIKQKEHCAHECVCGEYELSLSKGRELLKEPCASNMCPYRAEREASQKQHDAAIRNATLDEVERGIRAISQTHFASVMDLIESLRAKEQP